MDDRREIFEEILRSPFRIEYFSKFSNEFFNNLNWIDEKNLRTDYWNWSEFSVHISGYYHIANFIGGNKEKIAVLAVELKDRKNLDRGRGFQRNFVKKLLVLNDIDGAFVAFYAKDEVRWRLSFIKLDYEFAMGKVIEKITPAKRYSYLVGEGEPCHTALTRLYPIFMDEGANPTIADIEDAFSVEKVTKEFFDKYRDKYHDLKEYLESNEDFVAEAKRLNFTSEQFAKKLMGQIVFLYFIQKKGWLGVNSFPRAKTTFTEKEYEKHYWYPKKSDLRAMGINNENELSAMDVIPKVFLKNNDNEFIFIPEKIKNLPREEQEILSVSFIKRAQPWGTGPRDFIRKLFEVSVKNEENFYDCYLEPLFYEALNEPREKSNYYYYKLNCRIPFLNGGLFEPIKNFNWSDDKFSIPNEIFSNADSKDKHESDGILDVFDRYNFTMHEDEPLEKEVAVDPEMLGKVFENLLDAKDRKAKGAFYTPREIVHYMCQESLVNYLIGETGISSEAIRDFIVYGDFMKDEDTKKSTRESTDELYISTEILDRVNRVNRLEEIDNALANIKIADPAVGSGAFPLGMVSEIVRARRNIIDYKVMLMEHRAAARERHESDWHPLMLKLHTIKNSIYAVDIEPSAVDITKLRLWLSLVVEQEINEDNADEERYAESRNPRPLPNLDCNIRCGNSLIDELDGVRLINESDLFGKKDYLQQYIGQGQYEQLLKELFDAQDKLFYAKHLSEKEELKNEIRSISDVIVKYVIEHNLELSEKYSELRNKPSPPFFLWQLEFARVFKEKGGFDVVIGNPPYIHLEHIKEQSMLYKTLNFESYEARGDIYSLFYEIGVQLLKEKGILCYITSNKWMRAAYGKSLRRFFAEKTNPVLLIDFAGQQIFDATVDTNILLISKIQNAESTDAVIIKDKDSLNNLSVYVKQNSVEAPFVTSDSWAILSPIEQSIKRKIEAVGTPLKDWDIRINYGIKTGCNEAFIISGEKRDEILRKCTTEKERNATAELIRPILRGRDIKRYGYEFADLYLIATHNGYSDDKRGEISPININDYPSIKSHLDDYLDVISIRTDKGITPYNLRNCAYMDDFSKQKIVWADIAFEPTFLLIKEPIYFNNTCYMIVGAPSGLVDLLNSKLTAWYFPKIATDLGRGARYFKQFVELLSVPNNIENRNYSEEEIFDIYGLTNVEMNLISSSVN